MKDTLLVIPAFNEEQNLPAVLEGAEPYLDRLDVLVVDDGSADDTARFTRKSGFKCIRLTCNLGIGGALETGYKYAYRAGYQYVVRMDGDGQHDPEYIPALLEVVQNGEADFVSGSRFLAGKKGYVTKPARRVGIYLLAWLVNLLTGKSVTDPTSGFRAFNRKALEAFMEEYPTDFPEVESILYLHRRRCVTKEVPVRFRPRKAGRSSINFWRSIYYMYKVTFALLILTVQNSPKGVRRGGKS